MKNWNEIVSESYNIPKNEVFMGEIELIESMPENIKIIGRVNKNYFNIDAKNLNLLIKHLENNGYKLKSQMGSSKTTDSFVYNKMKSNIYISLNNDNTKATITLN
jgi:ABC-type uncharacterized transport system substrate-binding protein